MENGNWNFQSLSGTFPAPGADHVLSRSMDLHSMARASLALSKETSLPTFLASLTGIMIEGAGAQTGCILAERGGLWVIETSGSAGQAGTSVEAHVTPLAPPPDELAMTIIDHVAHTREPLFVGATAEAGPFTPDSYHAVLRPRSFLCMPMIYRDALKGIIYLESGLVMEALAPERLELLNLLATQGAGFLENADLSVRLQQAEAQARTNELRFRHFFENLPLCIFEVDLTRTPPLILAANRRAEAVYGYSAEVFVTMSPAQLAPLSARPEITRIIECVRAGETVSLESINRRQDGSSFPVRIIATPEVSHTQEADAIPSGHPGHMIVTIEDIAAERQRRSAAEAIDEERRRISGEMHDGVSQDLAALRLKVALWRDSVGASTADMHAALDELQQVLDGAILKIRRAIYALRPVALDEAGFFPAARRVVTDFENQYQAYVSLEVSGPQERLPVSLELPLFHVLQEALTNIGKHAGATLVSVIMDMTNARAVKLIIRDNGAGFETTDLEQAVRGGHLGLKQMRERVEKVGGSLWVTSEPGQGTELRVALPLV